MEQIIQYSETVGEYAIHFVVPVLFLIGGIIAGFIIERFIITWVKRIAKKAQWKEIDIIARSFQGLTKYIIIVFSVYGAVNNSAIREDISGTISKILIVLTILIVTVIVARVSLGFLTVINERSKSVRPVISIFTTLAKITIYVIGFLVVLQFLGITITPIITALGVGGLAVALALQDTLSNIFSGIYIIATKQIVVGNYIQLDQNIEGYVRDITWRNATIETFHNNMVIVPNAKLASQIIKNYSLPMQDMTIVVHVGVSYESNLEHVERVTIEAAKITLAEVPGAVTDFEPFIRYHKFDDFSINFKVYLRASEFLERLKIQHDFIKRLHQCYRKEGIIIPFPIRTVQIQEGMKGEKVNLK